MIQQIQHHFNSKNRQKMDISRTLFLWNKINTVSKTWKERHWFGFYNRSTLVSTRHLLLSKHWSKPSLESETYCQGNSLQNLPEWQLNRNVEQVNNNSHSPNHFSIRHIIISAWSIIYSALSFLYKHMNTVFGHGLYFWISAYCHLELNLHTMSFNAYNRLYGKSYDMQIIWHNTIQTVYMHLLRNVSKWITVNVKI